LFTGGNEDQRSLKKLVKREVRAGGKRSGHQKVAGDTGEIKRL